MEEIANFIIENHNTNIKEVISIDVIKIGDEMIMNTDEIYDDLFRFIDISEVTDLSIFYGDYQSRKKKIISFKYNGVKCDIGDYLDTQVDYFWVTIYP